MTPAQISSSFCGFIALAPEQRDVAALLRNPRKQAPLHRVAPAGREPRRRLALGRQKSWSSLRAETYALDLCASGRRATFAPVGCRLCQSERQSCHHQCRVRATNGSAAMGSIPHSNCSASKRTRRVHGCMLPKPRLRDEQRRAQSPIPPTPEGRTLRLHAALDKSEQPRVPIGMKASGKLSPDPVENFARPCKGRD